MAVLPGTEIDFKIEKEDWSILELDDGSRLMMRPILTKIVRAPEQGSRPPGLPKNAVGFGFNISCQNIVVVKSSPAGLRGTPQRGPHKLDDYDGIEVGFTVFHNPFNIYRLETSELPRNSKIKIQLVFSSVERYDELHDQFGYPLYRVYSTTAIIPELPKKRRRKKRG